MVKGNPIVWVKKKPDTYRMVSDEQGVRLEPSGSPVLRVMAGVFVLMLAVSSLMFSVGLVQNGESVDDAPSVTGCWEGQTEIILGGNPPYCFDQTLSNVIESIEVSEDQHIRERGEDWETGYTYTEEYRWEDVGDSVVYGFIENGRYICGRFVPEFSLPEDWVPADIDGAFEYPDWCGSSVDGQEGRVYEEGAHPYDDVWMYEANDVGSMATFLYAHKTTEDRFISRLYISKSLVELDRAQWEEQGEFPPEMLICSVPLTLFLLFAADTRRRVFVVDRGARSIIRKRRGPFPSFSRTWKDVDFSATTVVRSVRQKHHSSAATEDSPAEHWTTYHPGLSIVIRYGQYQQVHLFFEDGGDVNVHGQVIADFMAAMGVKFNPHDIHNPQADMYARPTLEFLAEYNGGVTQWNDHTANFIIGWYYESDPDFMKKYPQAEHDPEFMLEPHGDRPLKEMYRRPLYEGAGLTTVRSTEDAQRLLDHVLSLRYPESASEGNMVKGETKTVVDASVAFPPPSSGKGDETVDVDFGRKDDNAMGSFWTFDDGGNP